MSAGGALLGLGGLEAFASYQAGRAQAKGLAAQSTMARLQARQEALKYKQQGVAVLDNILRTKATLTAKAGAGSIDAFSGSAAALSKNVMAQGAQELYTVRNNELIAIRGGEMQAGLYMSQATSAMRAGLLSGLASFGQAYATKTLLGTPV